MKRRPRGHPGIEPADATPGTAGAGKAGAPLWEELYLTQRQGLIRFACRYTDPHQAEDIVQDAFLRIWDRSPLWLHTDGAPARLKVTVRRLCLTYLRRARRLVVSDPEGLDTLPGHPETNGNAWPKALASLLETLPPLQAQALRWGCDGMCLREIALRQRVPPGTVKWRMCAARLRLRKFLEERPNLFDG